MKISKKVKKFNILEKFDFLEKSFEDKIKIGLDIGAHSIKVVQLKRASKGPSLIKLGYAKIPQPPNDFGQSKPEEDTIAQALSELWRDLGIKERRVRLVISDSSIYLRHISIPQVAEDELARAIKWQAEKYVPFSIDNAIVDFQTLGTETKYPGQMEIAIVAVQRQTIDRYLRILKSVKAIPVLIDISAFATARSFLENYYAGTKDMAAIIDIGALVSSVVIMKGSSLQFTRDIKFGGYHFTQAIARGLNLDIDAAEVAKRQKRDIFTIIEPLLNKLANEICRSFAYCEREFLVEKIDRVVLCGGGALLRRFDVFLKERLGVPVQFANPFQNIDVRRAKFDAEALNKLAPKLMAALGVAL